MEQFYYKKNRIQQLRGFYYSVQTGSISKAAKKMGLSQVAVTLQVQSLERDLGIQVFTRDKHKINLTKAGKILYAQASYHIQGIDDIFESLSNHIKNQDLNTIDIGANHAVISYILPKYIKKFKSLHPQVKFKIRNLSKNDCIQRLLDDKIDAFIYPMNQGEVPDELEFIPIVKYQPILLTSKKHPLGKLKKITLHDVAKYELIRIDPHLITLPAFEEITESHNLQTSIEFEMSDWEILKKFVALDIGVAIISNIVLEGGSDNNFSEKLLTNYFPEMTYGILFKKGKFLKGLLKNFIDSLYTEKLLEAHKKTI